MKRWKPIGRCPEFDPESPPARKNIREALSELSDQKREKNIENPEQSLAIQTMLEADRSSPRSTVKEYPTGESRMIRLGMGAAMMFLVTFLLWPKYLFKKNTLLPHTLAPSKKKYLGQVAEIQSNQKALFRMVFNQDRNQLWLAGNYKGEGKVFLTLTSNPDKTLSLKKIIVTSEAPFYRGYARFTEFSLVKGNWPVPGEYRAKIHLYPKDHKKPVVTWKGIFILPVKEKQSLSQSLEHWKKNVHTRYLFPLKIQYQYYQTLKSHLINMKGFYTKSFQAKTWQEFSSLFEQQYNREIGPLLQRFILDGRYMHLSLFNSDTENSKEYEKLFLYGKKIGDLASDMLTETGRGKIKKSEKRRIKEKLLSRLERLVQQADSALKGIQKKINYYQGQLPQH